MFHPLVLFIYPFHFNRSYPIMPLVNPLFPNLPYDKVKHDGNKLTQIHAFRESADWLAAEAQREGERAMSMGDTKDARALSAHAERLVDSSVRLMEESMRIEDGWSAPSK